MKISEKPKRKRRAAALLCLAGLFLLIGGSYAAYTRQAYQRGVARNRDTETVSFSSNFLQRCANGTPSNAYVVKNIVYGEAQKNETLVSFDIYVYNYSNGNKTLASDKDISYTMKIEFNEGSGSNYTVQCDSDGVTSVSNNVYEVTKTLTGRSGNENKYTVSFPGNEIDRLKITATAIPTNTTITNNQILTAILVPCTSVSMSSFRAEGSFIDKAEGSPQDFDGFNYEVSISGGEADAVLTWDQSIVEIDQYFLKKLGSNITTTSEQKSQLTFKMNRSEGTGDYLISFYIKSKEKIPKTWDEMNQIITFTATQSEQN